MKTKLERLILSDKIPGAEKFNKWIDALCSAIENVGKAKGAGIAHVTNGPGGINIYVPPFPIAIVKTTSTITARSGATPGFGTGTFQMFNQTSFVDDTALTGIKILNFSSNSTLTVSGKYGVAIKLWGAWWLIIVEC